MSRLEHRFLSKLGEEWESATPGFCVQAFSKGKKIVDVEVGETYPFYDWASITKVVFTTTALMHLHDAKVFKLTDPVSRWVSWFPKEHPAQLKHLLNHTAGMVWWYPFFKTVAPKTEKLKSPEEAWQVLQGVLKRRVLLDLKKNGMKVGVGKSVYSDLDFFLLGAALESIAGAPLYDVWTDLRDLMGLDDTDFHRGNRPVHDKKLYAPTEKDAWRGRTMQGEVHDENTWSVKGVSSHAGLFGPIQDLSRWGLLLRAAVQGKTSSVFPSPETVRLFTKRSLPAARGDWGLGFMMPTKGSASCGPLFSPVSIGHTGFTGTSVWFDPKKDLLVTILSNRVHPTRENKAFQQLRPRIHSWIAEELST